MYPEQLTSWSVIIPLLVGILLGGFFILAILRILAGIMAMFQPRPYYPETPYPDYRSNNNNLFILFFVVAAILLVYRAVNSDVVKRAINDLPGFTSHQITEPTDSYFRPTAALPSEPPSAASSGLSQTAKVKAAAASDPYVVKLGTYSEEENAKREMDRLSRQGYVLRFYTKEGSNHQTLFVVVVGENLTYEEALNILESLENMPDAVIIPSGELDLHYFDL